MESRILSVQYSTATSVRPHCLVASFRRPLGEGHRWPSCFFASFVLSFLGLFQFVSFIDE